MKLRKAYDDPLAWNDHHCVVSVIGDTGVGKSRTIAELLKDDSTLREEDHPFFQKDARDQKSSTSANVKFYTSKNMIGGDHINEYDRIKVQHAFPPAPFAYIK